MTVDDLAGRNAIVTGGGSGIGRAIALELSVAGVNTLIAGRRGDALDETVSLSKGPGRLIALAADIREPVDRARVVAAAVDQLGGLDILVNNAGVTSLTPLLDYTVEEWRNVIATHAEAAFPRPGGDSGAAQIDPGPNHQHRLQSTARWASTTTSTASASRGTTPAAAGPVREFAYAAAKGAVLQLTRELPTAVGRWRITVNSVTPGMIPVDAIPMPADTRNRLARSTPLGRVGRPEEIAAVVRFIAGAGSSFMTGSEVRVDGGWSIW